MPESLRVLHLLDTTQLAGTEYHVLSLITAMRPVGVEGILGCQKNGPLARAAHNAGIDVLPLPRRLLSFAGWRSVAPEIKRRGISVVHAHNGRTKLFAAILRRRMDILSIATQHFVSPQSTTYWGPKRFFAGVAHRWVGANIDYMIAISNVVRDAMLQRHEVSPNRVLTVHNGIAPLYLDREFSVDCFREQLGLAPNAPFIFCAARLEAEKDVATLIAAMKDVCRIIPSARCFIAGEGDRRSSLEQQIASLGLSHNVDLLGFRIDVHKLMLACDVFVLPSKAEPFGLVLLEAMALEKPVIATNAGGPPEIVQDGSTGLLVSPSNAVALAAALVDLLKDPIRRKSMGQAGFHRFARYFTDTRMAQETLAVYSSAITSTPTPHHKPEQRELSATSR